MFFACLHYTIKTIFKEVTFAWSLSQLLVTVNDPEGLWGVDYNEPSTALFFRHCSEGICYQDEAKDDVGNYIITSYEDNNAKSTYFSELLKGRNMQSRELTVSLTEYGKIMLDLNSDPAGREADTKLLYWLDQPLPGMEYMGWTYNGYNLGTDVISLYVTPGGPIVKKIALPVTKKAAVKLALEVSEQEADNAIRIGDKLFLESIKDLSKAEQGRAIAKRAVATMPGEAYIEGKYVLLNEELKDSLTKEEQKKIARLLWGR